MTKTGKPDGCWAGIMHQYAQGKHRFSTGQRPKSKKWKSVIQRIDACPLKPIFNLPVRYIDIFGRRILCKCGYHVLSPPHRAAQVHHALQLSPPHRAVQVHHALQLSPPHRAVQVHHALQLSPPHRAVQTTTTHLCTTNTTHLCTTNTTHLCTTTTHLCTTNTTHLWTTTTHLCTTTTTHLCTTTTHLCTTNTTHLCTTNTTHLWTTTTHLCTTNTTHLCTTTTHLCTTNTTHLCTTNTTHLCTTNTTHLCTTTTHLCTTNTTHLWTTTTHLCTTTTHLCTTNTTHLCTTNTTNSYTFKRVIKPAGQDWIATCLYEPTGQLRQQFSQNWFHLPNPPKLTTAPPEPMNYYRQRMFLWAPMRMWGIPLKCAQCGRKMHHSGIYPKVREVIDLDSRYYLVGGDYPRCSKCMIPVCPWSADLLVQLDPAHRNRFPAVLTAQMALDRKCVTMLKPRTVGNSSSCSKHWKKSTARTQWFETVHANEILGHLEEMKGIITSTYGRILKLDSKKKITKKLAGAIADTATWMTNVSNECGEVLNCVLTTGEGAGLEDLCQGIVKRYQDAGEPEPEVIYVDRDCCNDTGLTPVQVWFRPWKTLVKLDIFHYMRRFTTGLTTEHHPLYGTFCSKMSSCIFEWDKDDISHLKEAKTSELKKLHAGQTPSEAQVLANISSSELAKHCRRRTRGIEESRALIQDLLNSMWELTDRIPLVWNCTPKSDQVYKRANTFIPGWRSNAMHTQMYMLEGSSRWNMNRAHAAVHVSGASQTRIYNVRLKTNLNALSQRVLGCALLPEFIPPGKPTGERIAVEYLLAQSDRGDLLGPQQDSELGTIVPDRQVDVQEEECLDITISDAVEILSQRPSEVDTSAPRGASPHTSSQNTRCDSQGVQGWEAVDDLANYIKWISNLKPEVQKRTLPGPWRASRKRSGSAPGQQAAERLFMTHGQAALRPDANRICECVSLRLLKEFELARNRPKDSKGKTLPIPQSMVQSYVHIKQLLEDSLVVQEKTDLVLVTINNTTVSCWLQERQKRTARDSLLQGVQLPEKSTAAEYSLPLPRELPTEPVQHGHVILEIQEPDNREVPHASSTNSCLMAVPHASSTNSCLMAVPRASSTNSCLMAVPRASSTNSCLMAVPRASSTNSCLMAVPRASSTNSCLMAVPRASSTNSCLMAVPRASSTISCLMAVPRASRPGSPSTCSVYCFILTHTGSPSTCSIFTHTGSPSTCSVYCFIFISPYSSVDKSSVDLNRRRKWRHEKTAQEDQVLAARGEPPKKRFIKEDYHYQCKSCGQSKRKHWPYPA
ncbi:hypothetical protein JOQ06_018214 [Pogonophryne albipinna]|uniref:DUF6729 domain-containing protein n=1 Tax=Pogonophryne albipinna TaxID=1090488 RepID=A0AAD6F8D1_9TELE|nr:hypothetical protein JOQ06_018214 [Pogonophryne albipinna]